MCSLFNTMLYFAFYREKNAEEETGKTLASAPSTLLSGAALPDIEGLDLTFKPSMGEMSSLALPENLPLDFIASKFSLYKHDFFLSYFIYQFILISLNTTITGKYINNRICDFIFFCSNTM